jgi:hypothetical protein
MAPDVTADASSTYTQWVTPELGSIPFLLKKGIAISSYLSIPLYKILLFRPISRSSKQKQTAGQFIE